MEQGCVVRPGSGLMDHGAGHRAGVLQVILRASGLLAFAYRGNVGVPGAAGAGSGSVEWRLGLLSCGDPQADSDVLQARSKFHCGRTAPENRLKLQTKRDRARQR